MSVFTSLGRTGATVAVAVGAVVLGATSAGAHVTVSSPDASPGGFGKLVFRVPSESDTAWTESVTVGLPEGSPFSSVSTKAMPGWRVETTTDKLDEPVTTDGFEITEAVTEVTWIAESGSALDPHEFAEFELTAGPFPQNVDTLTFPVTQNYSDGEVAAWDEPTVAGEAEPQHPAPVLELASATLAPPATPTAGGQEAEASVDNVARTLGGVGLVLGLLALLLRGVRRRKHSS